MTGGGAGGGADVGSTGMAERPYRVLRAHQKTSGRGRKQILRCAQDDTPGKAEEAKRRRSTRRAEHPGRVLRAQRRVSGFRENRSFAALRMTAGGVWRIMGGGDPIGAWYSCPYSLPRPASRLRPTPSASLRLCVCFSMPATLMATALERKRWLRPGRAVEHSGSCRGSLSNVNRLPTGSGVSLVARIARPPAAHRAVALQRVSTHTTTRCYLFGESAATHA